jgi:hypothetical protein
MPSYEEFVQLKEAVDNGFLVLVGIGLVLAFAAKFLKRRLFLIPDIGIGWIIPIALLLRLPGMVQSFWYDEAFTAAISSLSFDRAIMVIFADVHPPLAYLPFWVIGQLFGTVPVLMRLPSFLAGLGIILALWRIGSHWGKSTGQVAALIGAVMPALIWYSAEARAYSFLVLAVLIVLIAIQEKRPLILAIALGLLPLVHIYGYLYAGFLGIYILWQKIAPLKLLMLAAIPGLLWLPIAAIQSSDVANGFWLPSPTIGTAIKPLVDMLIRFAYPAEAALVVIPLIVAVSLLALAHSANKAMMPYWIVFAGVPLVALLISWLWHPIYLSRALLPATTILIIFFAKWITEARPLAAALLYTCLAIVLPFQFFHADAQKIDLGSFVAQCGDSPIYAISIESAIIADAYSTQPVYVFSDWNNLNQALPGNAIMALNYHIQNAPARGSCVYWQDTPMTSERQRVQRNFAVASLGLACSRVLDKEFYVIEVCQ